VAQPVFCESGPQAGVSTVIDMADSARRPQ